MTFNGRKAADCLLIAELASGKTVTDAAGAAGVSARTAFRRLSDPAFNAQVAECRGRLLDETLGRLTAASKTAAEVMVDLLAEGSPDKIRLAAAKAIIDSQLRVAQVVDLERRILELEARLAGQSESGVGP